MRKIRPFWGNDVVKTEIWLDALSKRGWELKRIHFKCGIFEFEPCDATKKNHRIVYQKGFSGFSECIPKNLVEDGYKEVCCGKNFYVLSTEKEPMSAPSYAGFLERNQKRAYVTGIIALIGTFWFSLIFIFLLIIFGVVFFGGGTIESGPQDNTQFVFSWMEIVISIAQFLPTAVYIVCLGTWFKLRKTNKQLVLLCGEKVNLKFTRPVELIRSKQEIKKLKKEKLLIKKTKLGWAYAPDKVEIWLENMEAKGFNLCYMSKLGNSFYFLKGTPRKMKYVVDNQKCAMPEYFNINQDAGWKLIFRSLTRSDAYIVWAQEVTDNRVPFMCDAKENMKRSRRLVLIFGISYGFIIVLYISTIFGIILRAYQHPRALEGFDYYMIGLFLFVIIEFGYFILNALGYYLRMRKKYKQFGDIHF